MNEHGETAQGDSRKTPLAPGGNGVECFGDNPFSTRHVRPGALPFLFASDQSAAQLIDRLRCGGWWGQILGPHGSGKSALLAALIPAIEAAGRRVVLIELHDGQRRLPRDFYQRKRGRESFLHRRFKWTRKARETTPDPFFFDSTTTVVVDGYEQLGRFSRGWLKRFCRRRRLGLLVTAHESVGLPELFRTAATLAMAERIVTELLRDQPKHVTVQEVAECFSRHGGNLREMLFALYDVYETKTGQV